MARFVEMLCIKMRPQTFKEMGMAITVKVCLQKQAAGIFRSRYVVYRLWYIVDKYDSCYQDK